MEKSIIFVSPLSPTLQDIKKKLERKSDVVIYEVEEIGEYNQIVGILEKSVSFSSQLKVTVAYLENSQSFTQGSNALNVYIDTSEPSSLMKKKVFDSGLDLFFVEKDLNISKLLEDIDDFFEKGKEEEVKPFAKIPAEDEQVKPFAKISVKDQKIKSLARKEEKEWSVKRVKAFKPFRLLKKKKKQILFKPFQKPKGETRLRPYKPTLDKDFFVAQEKKWAKKEDTKRSVLKVFDGRAQDKTNKKLLLNPISLTFRPRTSLEDEFKEYEEEVLDYGELSKQFLDIEYAPEITKSELRKNPKRVEDLLEEELVFFDGRKMGIDLLAYSCEFLTAKSFIDKAFLKFLSLLLKKQFQAEVTFVRVIEEDLLKIELDIEETQAQEAVLLDFFGDKKEELFNLSIPTWRDESFQEALNYFLFPYYENSKLLALGITVFDEVELDHLKANDLEQFLKLARCCFLEA